MIMNILLLESFLLQKGDVKKPGGRTAWHVGGGESGHHQGLASVAKVIW